MQDDYVQTKLLSSEDTFQPLLSIVVIVMLCSAHEHRAEIYTRADCDIDRPADHPEGRGRHCDFGLQLHTEPIRQRRN
ncbi:hypothetical protein ILYODFUR_021708 [Ilyodon furcidens]|uniref:Uncharacterized protein n=1 Tax=Ilyodon furcidens TaxID=33524 RepID=A0ABV0VHG7_9TELE